MGYGASNSGVWDMGRPTLESWTPPLFFLAAWRGKSTYYFSRKRREGAALRVGHGLFMVKGGGGTEKS